MGFYKECYLQKTKEKKRKKIVKQFCICPFLLKIISTSYLFIAKILQGIFVCNDVIFGCDDPHVTPVT